MLFSWENNNRKKKEGKKLTKKITKHRIYLERIKVFVVSINDDDDDDDSSNNKTMYNMVIIVNDTVLYIESC